MVSVIAHVGYERKKKRRKKSMSDAGSMTNQMKDSYRKELQSAYLTEDRLSNHINILEDLLYEALDHIEDHHLVDRINHVLHSEVD